MPSRKGGPTKIIEGKVFTTVEEVEQAIVKLKRRLEEVQALDPTRVRFDDPRAGWVITTARRHSPRA